MSGKGWHIALYNERLLPMLLAQKPASRDPYEGQAKMFDVRTSEELRKLWPNSVAKGPSSNFTRMGAAGWLLWSTRYGVELDQGCALQWVWEVLEREDTIGLWLREQLACDPHAQFHLAAELAIRIAAIEGKFPDLLEKSNERWRQLRTLWRLLATPDGEIIAPATRAGDTHGKRNLSAPANQVATAIYREIERKPQTGVLKGRQWWLDTTWGRGPASVIRDMVAEGDTFGGKGFVAGTLQSSWTQDIKAHLPKLRLPLNIIRRQDGHAAWFEGIREDEPICDWVDIEYNGPGKHSVACGFDFEHPYQANRAATVRIA